MLHLCSLSVSTISSLAIPDVGKLIDEVVTNDPSIPTKALEIQLQKLILVPLQQVSEQSNQPIVIIIDGLDELTRCGLVLLRKLNSTDICL